MNDRKYQEAEFHNHREKLRKSLGCDDFYRRYPNLKFYAITYKSKDFVSKWLAERCPGKTVLDYCCGRGDNALYMARCGAETFGIDISAEEIQSAQKKTEGLNDSHQVTFKVMDAENLEFEDNYFDYIYCSGVLHHLDINHAYPEIARVLKPGGQVICIEALGYNPVIHFYRKLTPHLRTNWEAEHILTLKEVNQARQYFNRIEISYFHLFSILAIPFQRYRFFKSFLKILDTIDTIVLKIPLIRLMAWQMIFILSEPKKKVRT